MRAFVLSLIALALLASSCSTDNSSPVIVERPPVATVSVDLTAGTLSVGQATNGVATLRDAAGSSLSDRVVDWQSSSPNVATVSSSGNVSALTPGTTSIRATSEGVTGEATLTVTAAPPAAVASVNVSPASATVQAGQTQQLNATLRDANNNILSGRSISWTTNNSSAATVSASGLVNAVAAGSATITATSEGVKGQATLTVTALPPPAVASVSVSPGTATVQIGQTQQLNATLRDANNNVLTGRTVTWSTNNSSAATVSSAGLVTGVGAGSATITATSEGVGGTSTITVPATSPPPPTTIFSDDFESGNLSKWNESNSTTQAVINDPTSAHSGNNYMRMTYGINGGDGGWMNKYFPQGFTRLYVRLWVRFSSNFAGGTKLVSLRGSPIGQPTLGVGRAGICPTGKDAFSANLVTEFTGADAFPEKMYTYWQDMWADSNGQCWGRYGPTPSTWTSVYVTPMPMMSKGVWHKVEFAVKMNSAANVADGAQEFWIDGVKYGDWKNIRWGDPAFVNLGVLQINGSATVIQTQTMDIDDLVLIYDYPSP